MLGIVWVIAPLVTGVVSLLLSLDPAIQPVKVKERIKDYSDSISTDRLIGGVVNAYRSIYPITLDDKGDWNKPEYYETIQRADLDSDSRAELLARSMYGIQTWKYNGRDYQPFI